MGTIKDFRDLEVWQEGNYLSKEIYKIISSTDLKTDYALRNQIDASCGSIPDNIAEGFEREGNKEFIQFLSIAKGSCGELRSQLQRLRDREYISTEEFELLNEKSLQLSKRLSSFIHYLKQSGFKGNKFKEPNSTYSKTTLKPRTTNIESEPETEPMKTEKSYYAHELAVVDEGCKIGSGTKIWHFTHIMPNCTIGENCNIGQNCVISPDVVLGNNVKIQNNVSVYTGVVCEDDVFLGPSMVFTNVINPRSGVNRRGQYTKTIVKKGASIGANATIVCGHDIGRFAFIGAGAVVTKEVPDYALVVGNPAKQIGWMSEYGHRLKFDENGIATCLESNEKYKLENNKVSKV